MATSKINKSAFVRNLPASMSAGDAVTAAAAKGIKLSDKFVHTIRYNAKVAAAKRSGGAAPAAAPAAALVKRGPGRPRKAMPAGALHPLKSAAVDSGHGLVAEVERIVEARVNAILRERFGALLGR